MIEIYMNLIVFLFINSIVAASAYQFLRVFNLSSLADNILAFALLFCSQIVLTEIILGVFGRLSLGNLIILNFIILLLTLLFLRKELPLKGLGSRLDSVLLSNKILIFVASCIVGFGAVKIFVNLVNPPFGWDCLNYHFTFPVEWLKHANLNNPLTISDDPSASYFPINGSLLFLWLMFPFKDVFLADLGQLPFFILCFIAVFSIARRIGINRDYSFLSAALFVLIPNFFKQLEIAYVDIILTSFFLISLNFLLLLNENFSLKNLSLCAIGLGLAFGTKTIALPIGAVISFLLILILTKQQDYKRMAIYLIICGSIIILLGGFIYIRNFWLTNNFLYPANIKIFGKTIIRGVLDISYYKAHHVPRDYSIEKLLFHEGLGIQTIILLLPAIFLAIPLTYIKNRSKLNIVFGYLLIMPFLLYFVFRSVIPASASRYLYSTLGLGLVIAFYCLDLLKINKKATLVLVIICTLASLSELARRMQIFYSLLLSGLVFTATLILFKKGRLNNKIKVLSCCVSIILFILVLGLVQRDYLQNEFKRYVKPIMAKSPFWPDATKAWNWLNINTVGNNIAYVGRPVPFPLYGTNFKNNVYYVSVNKIEPAKLHFFPDGYYSRKRDYLSLHENLKAKGNYRELADYSVWLNNLLTRNADYLFIYSLHQTKIIIFPLEDKWAKDNPDRFSPVFANETIHIYKIIN